MTKRCGFCKAEIDERSLEVCDRCGYGIWGEKMFKTICSNMDQARTKGDLFQGSITDSPAAK